MEDEKRRSSPQESVSRNYSGYFRLIRDVFLLDEKVEYRFYETALQKQEKIDRLSRIQEDPLKTIALVSAIDNIIGEMVEMHFLNAQEDIAIRLRYSLGAGDTNNTLDLVGKQLPHRTTHGKDTPGEKGLSTERTRQILAKARIKIRRYSINNPIYGFSHNPPKV